MAKITVMPSGVKGGVGGGNKTPSKRGICAGWSAGSARRNMNFLMSVDTSLLQGHPFAYTYTVRDIPDSHEEWARLIDNLRKRLYRSGALRDHWVTEWTKAGRPHLHGVVYADPDNFNDALPIDAENHWLALTAHLGTQDRGQYWSGMKGAEGWFKYVSKHAGRGYAHYQRQKGQLPDGWQQTGRMWGKGGAWPIAERQFDLDKEAFHTLRRLVRGYLCAETRGEISRAKRYSDEKRLKGLYKQLRYRKGMLCRNTRAISEVRGLNEWADQAVLYRFLRYIRDDKKSFVSKANRASN